MQAALFRFFKRQGLGLAEIKGETYQLTDLP
jgi:hypothetical protein